MTAAPAMDAARRLCCSEGMARRPVFFVSDSTGITAETVGRSLLTQFPGIAFELHTLRYVNTEQRAREAAAAIGAAREAAGLRPLVFSTLVEPVLRRQVAAADCLFLDFMSSFLEPLARELGTPPQPAVGHTHGVTAEVYERRMEAVNFALQSDDGAGIPHYGEADVILVGVSRSGKTPTCLYLALHYGVFAANYPLVEEDLERLALPPPLVPHRRRLFGLTLSAERLHRLREARQPGSRYASLRQCRYELQQAEALYRSAGIDHLDVTGMSVEEIATRIMARTGLEPLPAGPARGPGTWSPG